MKFTNALLPLLSLTASTLASPIDLSSRQDSNLPINQTLQQIKYTVMALRSASPVHFLPLTATAGRFYLGKVNTTTYCPDEVKWGNFCPPGNQTVFKDSCSLDALNPSYWDGLSEQTLWNTDDGVIGYDFSQVRPENSYNCPWYIGTSTNTAFAGIIQPTYGADGWLACPVAGKDSGIWQVLRSTTDRSALKPPMGDAKDCLGISLVALKYNDEAAAAYVYS